MILLSQKQHFLKLQKKIEEKKVPLFFGLKQQVTMILMNFFLKMGEKRCHGLAISLSNFGYLGHVTYKIYGIWDFPFDSQPPLTIFRHLLFFRNIQTIIFLSNI